MLEKRKAGRPKKEQKKVQVTMVNGMAGIGFVRNPGQVASVDPDDAKRLIAKGFATPVQARELQETATAGSGENRSA